MHAASIFIHRHTSQPHDISISGGSSQNAKILQSNWPLGPSDRWDSDSSPPTVYPPPGAAILQSFQLIPSYTLRSSNKQYKTPL